MSRYIRSIKKEFDFDGDKVTVTLRPILFEDTIRFNALERIVGPDGKDTLNDTDVTNLLREILPKYIEKIEGLKDAAGGDISVAELCTVSYFALLLSMIGGELIQSANPVNPLKPGEQ